MGRKLSGHKLAQSSRKAVAESPPPPPSRQRAFVILNPVAGRGRRSRRLDRYLSLLRAEFGEFEHAVTRGPGEEAGLVERALDAGADLIVAAGGDGTWSNVAERIVASGQEKVTFGLLPSGTGNDFAKGLGISYQQPEAAVKALVHGSARLVDVGRGTFWGPAGRRTRSFLLVAGFGLDTAVLDDVERTRFLPGELAYRLAALRQVFTFGSVALEYSAAGRRSGRGDHLMLAICNGSSVGGSYRIAPGARLDDGLFDVCAVRNGGLARRIAVFRKAARGTHETSPLVDLFQCSTLSVAFEHPSPYQLDGELQPGLIEGARFEVVPGALRVVVPGASDAGRGAAGE